jgi:ferredoxin
VAHADDKPFCIVGVKACDLKGFKVQDHVFKNHDCPDPFYLKLREQNFIIGADCTCAIETCFCLALGVKPHPQEDFDMNLSEVSGGFVVEIASAKARLLVEQHSRLFQEASNEQLTQRDAQRIKVIEAVEQNIRDNEIPHQDNFSGIIERNYGSDMWLEESRTCVECGACTIICPTCHCFLLYDQKHEGAMKRLRTWDSCMIMEYARVAGGANPRPKLWMRLRNRFDKKFSFFPKVANIYACTGCGRCVSACPAKIDIRKVLKNLVSNV